MKILLEKLFKWVEHFANTKYKLHALFWVAFTESSFFIVPPDVLIAPIALYKKYSARFLAVFTGVASTLGGIFGYGIGYFFFHTIGVSIINFYDAWDVFEKVKHLYESSTFLTVLVAAFTPIPYKVFTLAGGMFGVDLLTFVVASFLGRGTRFYIVGLLSEKYGEKALQVILKKYDKVLLVLGITVLVAIYFLLSK